MKSGQAPHKPATSKPDERHDQGHVPQPRGPQPRIGPRVAKVQRPDAQHRQQQRLHGAGQQDRPHRIDAAGEHAPGKPPAAPPRTADHRPIVRLLTCAADQAEQLASSRSTSGRCRPWRPETSNTAPPPPRSETATWRIRRTPAHRPGPAWSPSACRPGRALRCTARPRPSERTPAWPSYRRASSRTRRSASRAASRAPGLPRRRPQCACR